MCMAKLYETTEGDQPILEDIAYMIVEGDRIEVETLFGERRVFHGKVRKVDFIKSEVNVEAG